MNATTQDADSHTQPTGETETMTTDAQHAQETDAMPEHMATHARLRDIYLEKRKDLQTYVDRLRRNQKGAAAARQEAETSDARWRELLRENDGEVTREVRQLKRAVTDNRETAEELEAMSAELEKEYETRNIEVIEARAAYAGAVNHAREIELHKKFDRALAAVIDTPEGQALIEAMKPMKALYESRVKAKYAALERHVFFTEEEQKTIRLETQSGLPIQLASRLEAGQDATKHATPAENDPLETLKSIPLLDCEREYDGPSNTSQLEMRRRRRLIEKERTAAVRR